MSPGEKHSASEVVGILIPILEGAALKFCDAMRQRRETMPEHMVNPLAEEVFRLVRQMTNMTQALDSAPKRCPKDDP